VPVVPEVPLLPDVPLEPSLPPKPATLISIHGLLFPLKSIFEFTEMLPPLILKS
jgi:hypothetical protein